MYYLFFARIDRQHTHIFVDGTDDDNLAHDMAVEKIPKNFGAGRAWIVLSFKSESEIKLIDNDYEDK